ncbi:MAG TPA: VWA domain-containing protein [Acidobacteriota bacterium]|nr:VWA domain-containing protein [Acidobacteriota bacterium]
MDRDFILYMAYKKSFINRAYRIKEGGETFFQIDFTAGDEPGKETKSKRIKEVIFLLDCSGSMQGDSIQEAVKALEICLKGLEEGNYFNVYRFGSTFEFLSQNSLKYSDESLEKALEYLSKSTADLGGTEILGPLTHIYSLSHMPETERSIVLLTDGEIANEEQVVDLVRKHRKTTSFFPIGIGAGLNEFLIKGLSRAGRGACEFIHPGERIEPKVLRTFQKFREAGMEEAHIDWGPGAFDQVPHEPVFFSCSPVSIFARHTDGNPAQQNVLKVKGRISGVERSWEIPVSGRSSEEYLPVSVLWAREKIRGLEEGDDASLTGSRQADRKNKQISNTIIELSRKYSLLSSLTSFVAVEEREEKDKSTGEIVLRKVPAAVTVGWHGIETKSPIQPMAMAMEDCEYSVDLTEPSIMYCHREKTDNCFRDMVFSPMESISYKTSGKNETAKTDLLMHILSLQKSKGGLSLDDRMAMKLGIDPDQIRELAAKMEIEIAEDNFMVVSTAIILQILRIHFLSKEFIWRSVVLKSEVWLKNIIKVGKPKIDGRELEVWADNFVKETVSIPWIS